MNLCEFKGEEAFKVMGKIIRILREIFKDENVIEMTTKKEKGWILAFLDYSLENQSKNWLDLFVALNPSIKPKDVTTMDVLAFAYEFVNDEQMMSLFFSQSRMNQKKSIGSASENTEA